MASNDTKQISLGAYHVISRIAGSEADIRIRQSEHNITDYISNSGTTTITRAINDTEVWYRVSSGSRAEGLKFSTSDLDIMYILHLWKVTENFMQHRDFDSRTFLLMENSVTRPGFTFLRAMLPSNPIQLVLWLICTERLGDAYYLSNIKFKDWFHTIHNMVPASTAVTNSNLHGPCISGYFGALEVDHAFCLPCETWPTMANACIKRLLRRGWPSYDVIKRIVEGGCLFVPVGSKGSQYEHLEWRISFSLAEKELVHAMNHTQIMCYACLKIFLKEAINAVEPVKDLLCSYFLKSAVFWEITEGPQDWTGNTFLHCFWRCFTRLLGWVNNGYCPNFFIPQNNMFLGKIHGEARQQLLHHLSNLYSEGYKCLLRCASIRDSLITVIERPTPTTHMTQGSILDKAYSDAKVIEVVSFLPVCQVNYNVVGTISHILMKMKNNNLHRSLCKLTLHEMLGYLVLTHLFNIVDRHFPDNKSLCKLLRWMKQTTFDAARYQIFMALYCLRYQMYDEALCSVHRALLRFQNPLMMYARDIDVSRYRAAGGNHTPLHVMMRRYVMCPVSLSSSTCMPELLLECFSLQNLYQPLPMPQATLLLPPLVLVYFIKFLCHHHKSDRQSAESVLSDLSTLLRHDHGYHIPRRLLPISLEILGICQEMYGDYQGALSSYMTVLNQPNKNTNWFFKPATEARIRGLVEKMR